MIQYLAIMVLSSAIGLAKILTLASILNLSHFGQYISLFSVAVFLAILVSFGVIESTLKQFPRLWFEDDLDQVVIKFREISRILAIRYTMLLGVVTLVSLVINLEYGIYELLCVLAIGWGSSMLALFASCVRASDSLRYQQKFYLMRSIYSFIPALLLGYLLDWQGALLGETIGVASAVIYSGYLCKKLGLNIYSKPSNSKNIKSSVQPGGGKRLYVAFLLSSGIAQLDKMLINQFVGTAQAGTYGVVSIIYQVTGILVNIVTQRIGTKFIKLNHNNVSSIKQLFELILWVVGFALFTITMVGAIFLLKYIGMVDALIEQYKITNEILLYTGLIAALQIYSMLDFFLVAHDCENEVLVSSLSAFIVFTSCFIGGYMQGVSLEWYFIFVLISKSVHVLLQALFITKIVISKNV